MATTEHKPELIIIAGPNGSGKNLLPNDFSIISGQMVRFILTLTK